MKFRASQSIAILLLLFSTLTTLPAATEQKPDLWFRLQAPYFQVVGNTSPENLRTITQKLEQFHLAFAELFPYAKSKTPVPVRVLVFKTDAAFRPFLPYWRGEAREIPGYFLSGADLNHIALSAETEREQLLRVVQHEYSHALFITRFGSLPAWLNEGLAEFYSTLEVTNDQQIIIGKPIPPHVASLRKNKAKLLPLAKLLALDSGSAEFNERERKNLFYTQSWALVHHLMSRQTSQAEFARFLQLLRTGRSIEESLREAYQLELATLEKELAEYVSKGAYPTQSFHFAQRPDIAATVPIRTLSEAEAQFYCGDLLLHARRDDEAMAWLQRALQLDPQLPAAHAALGVLRIREGSFAAASQHLALAMKTTTSNEAEGNYLAHYYYAAMRSQQLLVGRPASSLTNAEVDEVRAHFNKAIALNPAFADAHSQLAWFLLMTGSNVDEAAALLETAITLAPARGDLLIQLSQAWQRQRKFDEARRLLEPIARDHPDPHLRSQAWAQLNAIEEQLRFKAEREAALQASGIFDAQSNSLTTDDPTMQPGILITTLRRPFMRRRAEANQVRGALVRLDCSEEGLTMVIQSGTRQLQFHSFYPDRISFSNYRADTSSRISCGALREPLPVQITFRALTVSPDRHDGEIVKVEFLKPE